MLAPVLISLGQLQTSRFVRGISGTATIYQIGNWWQLDYGNKPIKSMNPHWLAAFARAQGADKVIIETYTEY